LNNKEGILVRCPYYKYSDRLSISCEGFIEGTGCKSTFRNRKEKSDFIENFCAFYPNGCPLSLEIDERIKYEVEE